MNARPLLLWSLGLAAAYIALAWLLRSAAGAGLVGDDIAARAIQAVTGLGLAAYGNFMPKMIAGASASVRKVAYAQSVLRVGGWAMTLAGLAWAAIWAVAPFGFAKAASMAAVLAAVAVMLGYTVFAFVTCRRTNGPAAG